MFLWDFGMKIFELSIKRTIVAANHETGGSAFYTREIASALVKFLQNSLKTEENLSDGLSTSMKKYLNSIIFNRPL